MPDPQIIIAKLDAAREGLNKARNAVEVWRRGAVAGVNHTASQRAAIRAEFNVGLQSGKDGLTAVDVELLN